MRDKGLIIGLGNPGKEYEQTRHNFGFMVVDALLTEAAGEGGTLTQLSGKKDPFELWRWNIPGQTSWFIAKPLTYMNLSGEAARRILDYYRIEPDDMLVIHDELDLPLGRLRMKKGGSNAGHKGLNSIQQQLGTADFYRLRLGIGKGPDKGSGTIAKVLGRFSPEEKPRADQVLEAGLSATKLFMFKTPGDAIKYCSSLSFLPKPDKKAEQKNIEAEPENS